MPKQKKLKYLFKTPYEKRTANLKKIGFLSYKEYLRSDLWQSLKKRALKRDKYTCQACGDKAFQVHHKNYSLSALDGSNLDALTSICDVCHYYIEWDGDRKTMPPEANWRIKLIQKILGDKYK